MISVSGGSLSAGRALSLTGASAYFLGASTCVVSPVTLPPQDKEGFGSVISHEENVKFIFEESRLLHSNQLINEDFLQKFSQFHNLLENSQKKKRMSRSSSSYFAFSRL
ncbi:hypothetical protein M1K46_15045 [Fictibacillus sp. WQ 8-8]|uniref:hypothetical protein n=1 Tax=Fictibacillus sp. WQ 8-8 TaxID=2938788 RepID=UPI00210C50CE|nr:hypothetical protein [Fictibacillus sp. WQ 8-8]MCQ6266971.1 hypothetical protein [Fictibacillus sp. WQ 8-8]